MSDDPVRPRAFVLGVARMVAVLAVVTVVLAAGIHVAAGGLAGTVPAAEFDYRYDAHANALEITHAGGDAIAADALGISGTPTACDSGEWGSGRVTTDDTCVLENVDGHRSVRVVWTGKGTNRAVLDVWPARN